MLRKVYDEDLTAGGRLGIFLDSVHLEVLSYGMGFQLRVSKQPP